MPLRQTLHRPRPTGTNPPLALPPSITTYTILRARDAHPRLLPTPRELQEFDAREFKRRVWSQRRFRGQRTLTIHRFRKITLFDRQGEWDRGNKSTGFEERAV